jgi:hypothetical protein
LEKIVIKKDMVETRRSIAAVVERLAKRDIDIRNARVMVLVKLKEDLNSDAGVNLDEYVQKHPMKNSRIFYVIMAKQDIKNSVYKFGFANQPSARLTSYVHTYGRGDLVKLHILLRTKYDADVERERSFLYRLESKVKRYLRVEIASTNRGYERVSCPLSLIRLAMGLDKDPADVRTNVEMNRSRRLRRLMGLQQLPFGRG